MMSEVNTAEEQITRKPVRHYNPDQKDAATFLRSAADPGSDSTLIEIECHPGGGTPPHYHLSYAEHFRVISGTLTVYVNNIEYTLEPGDEAVAPIKTLHNFKNNTNEDVIFHVELRPGSVGFENAVKAGYGLARDGEANRFGSMPRPYHLAILLEWSEIQMAGFMKYLSPVFRMLARRARKKGIDRMLLEKYCGE